MIPNVKQTQPILTLNFYRLTTHSPHSLHHIDTHVEWLPNGVQDDGVACFMYWGARNRVGDGAFGKWEEEWYEDDDHYSDTDASKVADHICATFFNYSHAQVLAQLMLFRKAAIESFALSSLDKAGV